MTRMRLVSQAILFGFIFIPNQALSQILLNSLPSLDNTLVAGATGADVVDAALLKIDAVTGLRNDFGFLKRIALVESSFGATTGQNLEGIWQISSSIRNTLITSNIPPSVQFLINAFRVVFGSDATDFSKVDYRVPLHSAVAARIFIELQLSSSNSDYFPGSISDQANWWASNYKISNADPSTFINTVQTYEDANQCIVSRMDLWFLVDGSGSIGSRNFQTCLRFVNETASNFFISPERIRTGLIIYSSSTTTRSFFNQHQSNDEFSSIVLSTSYPSGGTNTGAAINETARIGFNETNGARPSADGVPRVLVVLTDGKSGDSVDGASKYVKSEGVTVFGVGVGSGFDEAEVNIIASDPDSTYAYALTDFSTLSSVLRDAVADQACSVPAVIPEGTDASFLYLAGTISYSQIDLPDSGSLELNFNLQATTSTCIVYISASVANPGPALYDASFEVTVGTTVAYYNVETVLSGTQQRRKRQTDASSQPTSLYLGFQTTGTERANVQFRADNRADAFNSGSFVKGIEISSIVLLNILLLFWKSLIC